MLASNRSKKIEDRSLISVGPTQQAGRVMTLLNGAEQLDVTHGQPSESNNALLTKALKPWKFSLR